MAVSHKSKVRRAAKAAAEKMSETSIRKPRTLSLDNGRFVRLQALCATNGWTASEVVDELIEQFLSQNEEG